ncbi:hypothetical protein [Microbispora sp. NPDC049633]|uniref:hypothetical protein n=1 Tax=Microbispora sp. NPDC049633 TaxID=3154355 RepID=UPI0034178A05
MEHGDIDNSIAPKVLVEFEDLIAHQNQHFPKPRMLRRRRATVSDWDLDDLVVKVMWHMVWNLHLQIEVITSQGEEFAGQLAGWLDAEDVPAQRVWAYEPRALARRLATMPYVSVIYTGRADHAALYGRWGRLVTAANVQQMGRF